MKLLVVAAWGPELVRFQAEVDGLERLESLDIVVGSIGVGLVEAAIGMTQCIVRHRPSIALLLGTCGAFASSEQTAPLVLGSVVTGSRVRLVDASIADGTSALPGPMPFDAAFDASLHDSLVAAGARSVQIANTVGITIDDARAARLARASGDAGEARVEHLEAFAFARACAGAGLPCAAALGVANVVGASGRAEWLANHESASANAADVAIRALAAFARTTTKERSPAPR